jgi:O-antigen/teichoic acid export membrane protein
MLGADGYGTYQAVGGFVTTLSVINVGISSAISRFITFELGRNDMTKLSQTFSTAINVLAILCIFILILAETAGVYFINNKMQFAPENMTAVNVIYQLAIFGYLGGVITMPFMAILVAYEEFKYIASFGLIQGISVFIAIVSISFLPGSRLMWYSWAIFLSSILYQMAYVYVCIKRHSQIKYIRHIDKQQFYKILSFSSFSFLGSSAGILKEQGVTVLINMFFGTILNAARGISTSVLSATSSLVGSFTTALAPQITKAYAEGNHSYMWSIVERGIRISFFLLLIPAIPIMAETEWILTLWLKLPPPMAAVFTKLTIISALCDTLSTPLIYLMNATGKIALYQCVVGGTLLITIPLDFLLLHLDFGVTTVLWVNIIISSILFFLRIIMIRRIIHFDVIPFIKNTLVRIGLTTTSLVLIVIPILVFSENLPPLLSHLSSIFFSALIGLLCILFIGLKREERKSLFLKLSSFLTRFRSAV